LIDKKKIQSQFHCFQRQVSVKPQVNFKHKINNDPSIPFIPKIRIKPNAIKPLPAMMIQMDIEPIDLDLLEKHPEMFVKFNRVELITVFLV